MYDVCIIGAGPAGTTLARLLGDRYRVLIVDPRPLGRQWSSGDLRKSCAGLLAPRAQTELARQGLGVPPDVVAGPQLFAVRTVDVPTSLERLYRRSYVNVDREAFDRWLASLMPPSVDVAWGWRAQSVEPEPGASFVEFVTSRGGRVGVQARLVVGADGAASVVRGTLARGKLDAHIRYAAVQARFDAGGSQPHFGAIFDERLTDFFGWTVPKADGLLVGAAFRSGEPVGNRFDQFVDRVRAAGFGCGNEASRESAALLRPAAPADVILGGEGVALVGEAAGLVSPSSAEGISFALRSGAALAEACAPGLDGAVGRYCRAALPLKLEVCAKFAKSSVIYGPALRHAVMRSGIGSFSRLEAALPPSAHALAR